MELVKRIIMGMIIGGGMILPGVSGGVLAVILGVYEIMLDALANFFKDIKKNILFLGPLGLGIVIGVFLFGKILFFVFDKYPMESKYTFMGLILGGVPALFKELEKKDNGKLNISALVIAFIIAVILFVLGKDTLNIDFSNNIGNGILSFVLLFITGVIFIAGKIIPGISSSFLLMLIGMYEFLLSVLNDPLGLSTNQYLQLIPFLLGIIVGAMILIKIIRKLIKNHFLTTYSAIIGFVVGSITAIYPGFTFDYRGLISLLLLIGSFVMSYKFTLPEQKDYQKY